MREWTALFGGMRNGTVGADSRVIADFGVCS